MLDLSGNILNNLFLYLLIFKIQEKEKKFPFLKWNQELNSMEPVLLLWKTNILFLADGSSEPRFVLIILIYFLILFFRFLLFPAVRSVESGICQLRSIFPPVPPLPGLHSSLWSASIFMTTQTVNHPRAIITEVV